MVVGPAGAGKSKILQRYCNDSYDESYISTVGVDFCVKTHQYSNGNGPVNAKA